MYEKILSRNPLMVSLPRREISRLIATLRQLEFPSGVVLFHEGDHGDRLYFILEGQLEIIKSLGTPDEHLLNICPAGDCVGEMCLLDPDRLRTASVRTASPVRLLEMTQADLDSLLHEHPSVGYAMARLLSQRLHASETKMSMELNAKNRQLSQAYAHLQSLLPQHALPPDPGIEGHATPGARKGSKMAGKNREIRQAIYRSSLSPIQIETLGRFRIRRGLTVMEEREWDGHLPKLLLKAIVAHGSHQVPKDQLIEALWPETAPGQGEMNFKITLHRLRKSIEPGMEKTFGSSYVHLKANSICLDEELCKTDFDDFQTLSRRGEQKERAGDIGAALLLYSGAVDLYRGDFLSEELYSPWIDAKRNELRKRYTDLLYRIADIREKRGTSKVAIDCYVKIIRIDPLSEQVYQRLMTLYANRGKRTEAIKVYHDCRKALREGLEAEPGRLTTSIYNKILEGA